MAGGYEFVQNEAFKPPTKKRLEFLAKAYDTLHYDVLFVTPYEREVLAKAGVAARPSWKGSQRLEQHMLSLDGKNKVAVLLLPPAPKGARALPQNLIHQVENAVQGLRGKVRLIVAMSSWGYALEQELLKSQGPHPDVLLGSGQGIGLAGMIVGGGRTVWMRSFSQGKALSSIEVLAWPDENSTFKWTEGKNIRMTLFGLTDQYQEDPAMLTLMHNMGTD